MGHQVAPKGDTSGDTFEALVMRRKGGGGGGGGPPPSSDPMGALTPAVCPAGSCRWRTCVRWASTSCRCVSHRHQIKQSVRNKKYKYTALRKYINS
jgi:hypothetical protein